MSLWRRVVHWLFSPVGMVLASFALIYGLDEWDSAELRAEYGHQQARRRAEAPVEIPPAPLFKAIQDKNPDAVRSAIARGADPNAPNDKGTIPLHFAFLKDGGWPGRRDVIEALLAGGANVNTPMKNGYTALHAAVGRSNKEVIELLLERGADVNARTKDGKTSLMSAASIEIAELLLARGAKWGTGETGIDPDGARMREAARKGDEKLVALLLARGADPNLAPKGRAAPIVYAITGGHSEAVRALLAAGAKADARNYDGSSLLHVAAESNAVEIAKLLIAAGSDVNATRPSGWTPLHVASSRCHEDFAALLVASGADPGARDKHGKAPLPCYPLARKPARGLSFPQGASCR